MSESTLKSDPHSHALLSSPCRPLATRGPVVFDPPHPVGGCCPPRCALKIEDRSRGPGRIDFRAPDEGFGLEGTPKPKIRRDAASPQKGKPYYYICGPPLYGLCWICNGISDLCFCNMHLRLNTYYLNFQQ